MPTFRRRPTIIEARQFLGDADATPIIDWVFANGGTASLVTPYVHSPACRCDGRGAVPGDRSAVPCPETEPTGDTYLALRTLEGTMRASLGDWVIKGTAGEFYPCKPEIFADVYESVE